MASRSDTQLAESGYSDPMDVDSSATPMNVVSPTPETIRDTGLQPASEYPSASAPATAQAIGWYYGVKMDGYKLPYMREQK